jgi:hypothetical protein
MKIPYIKLSFPILSLAWAMTGWSSVPIAIAVGILGLVFLSFGILDFTKSIRIENLHKMKHSASTEQFDRDAKRILGLVLSICFALTLGAVIWLSFIRNELKEKESQVEAMLDEANYSRNHSYTLPDSINVIIDGRKLQRFANTHKVMIACYVPNRQLDPLDNKNIHKSRLFDIANDDIGIEVRMDLMSLPGYMCNAAVAPKGLTADEVTTLRYIKNAGGRVFSAFSQYKTLTIRN